MYLTTTPNSQRCAQSTGSPPSEAPIICSSAARVLVPTGRSTIANPSVLGGVKFTPRRWHGSSRASITRNICWVWDARDHCLLASWIRLLWLKHKDAAAVFVVNIARGHPHDKALPFQPHVPDRRYNGSSLLNLTQNTAGWEHRATRGLLFARERWKQSSLDAGGHSHREGAGSVEFRCVFRQGG